MPRERPPALSAQSNSLAILRERGPLKLRYLTAATSYELDHRLKYADVDAVMRAHAERGEAQVVLEAQDYRDTIWAVK